MNNTDEQSKRLRGITAAKQGDPQTAIKELEPLASSGDVEVLYWLAVAQRAQQRFSEAAENFRKAASLNPSPVIYHDLGLCLSATLDFGGAIAAFKKAIELKPDSAPLRHSLGSAYQSIGCHREAAEAFNSAIELAPNDIHGYIAMAHLGLEADDRDNALWFFRKAYELEPNSFRGQLQLAHVLVYEGEYKKAEDLLRRLIQTKPDAPTAYGLLAAVLHNEGNFEEANELTKKAIALEPFRTGYYTQYVAQRKITDEDRPFIESMRSLLKEPRIRALGKKDLYFAVGKALNDLKEYKEAMEAYDEGNDLAYKCLPPEMHLDHDKYIRSLGKITGYFTSERIAQESAKVGSSSNRPIFIVGMPRSGTTLLDQILSSHHAVGSAGELKFWTQKARQAAQPDGGYIFSPQVAEEFLEELAKHDAFADRVVDKMPTDYIHLGLIRTYFPNAIFLHSKRNPIDNCISLYTTPGLPDQFVHRKEDIVFVYEQYLRMMDYWTSIVPADRMMSVQYEELLSDPETTIRGILDFCGLEWDPACLQHDQNTKSIATPSAWQARQPLYKTSTERWRNYEPWLGPFAKFKPA